MNVRPINYPDDYHILMAWWSARKAAPLDQRIFPGTGAVAENDEGLPVAMAFLYLDVGGAFAMIEWSSTNPAFKFSHYLSKAVIACWEYLENTARERGCLVVTSMVNPKGSEARLMQKRGYMLQSEGDTIHVMMAKPLIGEIPCQQSL